MARATDATTITLTIDGASHRAAPVTSVAAALLNAGVWTFRRALDGGARGPLCGMGICHECRVTLDGVPHQRACLVPVAEGMDVRTSADTAPRPSTR